jgi:UMF1 family MFS transporter
MSMKKETKAAWGWIAYDWANSAFACTVMAGFFPIFFKQYWSAGGDVNLSTAQLGLGNALSGLLVALAAPVLGAVADQASAAKRMLLYFAYVGAAATALLFLVPQGAWAWAIVVYALALLGFAGANIFYDALLPRVASGSRLDYVSSQGYAFGYLGGGLLFLLNVLMTLKPALFGLENAAQAVRLSFLSVALWWGGFSLITASWVPGGKGNGLPLSSAWGAGFRQLKSTLKMARAHKPVWLFLLAYWFYIDGVDTIIRMAVDYGLSLGFESSDLILALLLVQFVGFPAAYAFGLLAAHIGARPGIFLALGVYMAATIFGAFISQRWHFYLLAVVIGLVQGGVQALSRSYYARLIPPDQSGEFFGLYNMWYKFSAIMGPALVGLGSWGFKQLLTTPGMDPQALLEAGRMASRLSILSILVLFITGACLLYLVKPAQPRQDG